MTKAARKQRSVAQPERRIPDSKSRQERAEFWDTHDFTDYLDELTPVRARFAKNLSQGITIRLDPDTLSTLRALAKEQGLGPTTLIRMWILEHLHSTHGAEKTG